MIQLLDVAKSFADPGHRPRVVLCPTSIGVPHDRRVAILGGRGEGKSVLLHLLAGTAAPDFGRVLSPVRLSPVANSGGMLHPALSTIENIRVVARMSGIGTAAMVRAVDALGGLGARPERTLRGGSAGQRRALEAAIVTVLSFDCTLYDNVAQLPADLFAGCLDAATRRGRGAIFATANVRLARQFADFAVVIQEATLHGFARVADAVAFFERGEARIGSWAGLPAMSRAGPGAVQGAGHGRGPA